MQKAVALAHLRVACEPDEDDADAGGLPALPASPPQLLPVPSSWWETPAVTSRALTAEPEEARAARAFVRDVLTCWGRGDLADDAELIIGELVANAVRHGLSAVPPVAVVSPAAPPPMRLCLLRRTGEVWFAVTDPSTEPPAPKTPDAVRESGRGLQIVGALSYVWGWSPMDGSGKAVWAVLKHPA